MSVYFLHIGDDAQKSAQRLSKFIHHRIGFDMSVPAKKLVAQGTPSTMISSVARKIGADVIMMGSRGSSGLKSLVQGSSVAEKVLRQAPCPVLIVKKRKRLQADEYMFPQIRNMEDVLQVDKILVPLDFSPASREALHNAVSLAARYNSTIYTLTIFDKKFKEYGSDREEHTSIIIRGEKIQPWREFPEMFQAMAVDPSQVRVKRMLVSGDPFSRIESVAEKKEIDLIIMGTNGRTGLEHLLLGSVAEKVLKTLDCPIMTIRHHVGTR